MNHSIRLVSPKIHDFSVFSQRAQEIFSSGLLTNNGPYVKEYEKQLSSYLGAPSLSFANGTIALILALKGLGLQGEVIVPSFTFAATVHAVSWAGLTPVFVDIDPQTFNLNPQNVEAAITDQTSAIVAVHVFGNPCDIDVLTSIAKKHQLKLIFDAAHAFGSTYKGRPIGQFGDVEMFSTHATKTLITAEGGILSTNDQKLIAYLKQARNFGFPEDKPEDTVVPGTNAKLSEVHAVIGLDSLSRFPPMLEHKRTLVAHYHEMLGNIAGIRFQCVPEHSTSAYLYFPIVVDEQQFGMSRDQLHQYLTENGIMTRKYFYPPVHKHTSYQKYHYLYLPHTEAVASGILCLPVHGDLTIPNVEHIGGLIRMAQQQNRLSS